MIIDSHTHIFKKDPSSSDCSGTLEDLFDYMRNRGVSRCAVLPITSEYTDVFAPETAYSTKEIVELSRKHPEKLIPFANINWRWDHNAQRKLRELIDLGCKAFGEVDHQLVVDDTRILPLYKLCGELGIPTLLHVDPYPINPDLDGVMRVLREFPDTDFIFHGPGWWKHISSRVSVDEVYPWGKVESGGKTDRILRDFPNAYADISASSGLRALQRDYVFSREFVERNSSKLLFGTDFPFKNWIKKDRYGADGLHISYLRSLGLSHEAFQNITYHNVKRLLKL